MRHDIYSPGAGHQPPLLVGREQQLGAWQRVLDELAFRGRVGARDLILTGPRGVGKTVLLGRFERIAERIGFEVIKYQPAVGQIGLVEGLAKQAALRLDDHADTWTKVKHSFENLAGVSLGAAGISATISLRNADRQALSRDPADLARALADLAAAVRDQSRTGGVLLTVDELQVADRNDLSRLQSHCIG